MNTWATAWAIVLASVLILYAGLAIVVSWGGFLDVKAMFATLKSQQEQRNDEGDNE